MPKRRSCEAEQLRHVVCAAARTGAELANPVSSSSRLSYLAGALYYLSLFYTKKQFALRVALLYSGSQLGNAVSLIAPFASSTAVVLTYTLPYLQFGGLLAIGILKMDGIHGIEVSRAPRRRGLDGSSSGGLY